jgi:hypothetical protein
LVSVVLRFTSCTPVMRQAITKFVFGENIGESTAIFMR